VKLSKSAKAVLDKYHTSGDTDALFEEIKANIATQNTIKSKHTRLSIFRGLLRNFFNMTDGDMDPIGRTAEQKQAYFDSNKVGLNMQHEDILTAKILKDIIKTDIGYLMVTSGLRIGEIILNKIIFTDENIVWAVLNKADGEKQRPIHILGPMSKWKSAYDRVKSSDMSLVAMTNNVNRNLKTIIPDTFYKRSSHIARAIYARYMYKFRNPDNRTFPWIIENYLHHENQASGSYYQHVQFGDDITDIFKSTEVMKLMSIANLRVLAKEYGHTRISQMPKAGLIELLSK
jgi:hypothetical protein